MIIKTGSITVKGQVTIPKEIREYLDVRQGDHIYFESSRDGIIIKKAYSKKLADMSTSAKPYDANVKESIKNI
ncbi:MAG: AbrB/MazE/SpoVT family DNA-binding domain-containing protein [Ferroplasma sp.]|uniref:AbrB/MazE/SpoVT family DNA-binding domain-containing protein n=1 Tax=Ferroplasma sp. TaxID=2591003 RepID=UPI002814CB05|nr:AbrB/MazE/SpoVT family DNA-binding domain-containing protein [Ferroplasma sp.]WMT51901.1 MAG: AbrB/MazE/SpoVT family DNA-binding domain-containing protein [Ferroplasma sp.]